MTSELQIIQPWLGKGKAKRTTSDFRVDPDIRLWLNFKKLCLENEDVRVALCEEEQCARVRDNVDDFTECLRKLVDLAADLPRGFRPQTNRIAFKYTMTEFFRWHQQLLCCSSPLQVVEEKPGLLGLCVRERQTSRPRTAFLPDCLYGDLYAVSEPLWLKLEQRGYPSLVVVHGVPHVAVGSMVLINERCDANKIALRMADTQPQHHLGRPTKLRIHGQKHHDFEPGERLWIRYDFGKRSVPKEQCICPDDRLHPAGRRSEHKFAPDAQPATATATARASSKRVRTNDDGTLRVPLVIDDSKSAVDVVAESAVNDDGGGHGPLRKLAFQAKRPKFSSAEERKRDKTRP